MEDTSSQRNRPLIVQADDEEQVAVKNVSSSYSVSPRRVASIVFAFLFFSGLLSQTITLPLWLDSVPKQNCSLANTSSNPSCSSTISPIFIIQFLSIAQVIVYGLLVVATKILHPNSIGEVERNFPHRAFMIVGFCNYLGGIFFVFSGSATRTTPYIQAILGNIYIPLIVLFRYLLLRKLTTCRKFVCAVVIVGAVFICLLPTIFPSLTSEEKQTNVVTSSGPGRILWPICYMTAFIPFSFIMAYEEKIFHIPGSDVNMIYFFLWQSVYQTLFSILTFWIDIIPGFGTSKGIHSFLDNWLFGLNCFFGYSGCTWSSGIRGSMFLVGVVMSLLFGALLIRHSEGALLLGIINVLITPFGYLFWTLFKDVPPSLIWDPTPTNSTWFSLGGLCIMVPTIVIYSFSPERAMSPEVEDEEEDVIYENATTATQLII